MLSKWCFRLKKSRTFNTWLVFLTLPLHVFLLLPLVLRSFDEQVVALWLLFDLIVSLQVIIDFGFNNTFIRAISYCRGGRVSVKTDEVQCISGCNWCLLKQVIGTMRYAYLICSFLLFIVLCLSTFFVKKYLMGDYYYWACWAIVVLCTVLNFYGRIYSNYLLGFDKVALVKRVEALFIVLDVLSAALVLYFTKSFIAMVIANQIWVLIKPIRNRYLCFHLSGERYADLCKGKYSSVVFADIWPMAWRSGISSLSSQGSIKLSGLLTSLVGNSSELASYLIALRVLGLLRNFSMAPFYSKIPLLSNTYAKGDVDKWQGLARKSIGYVCYIFLFLIILSSSFGSFLFGLISTTVVFPRNSVWFFLCMAIYFHCFGAMHVHLYATTNDVKSHISDVVSSVIYLFVAIVLVGRIGVVAFPIGMIVGYFGFYIWHATHYSYKRIKGGYLKNEFYASFIPIVLMIVYCLCGLFDV
jgi:O-antigen/teichoic acid export membrane protein